MKLKYEDFELECTAEEVATIVKTCGTSVTGIVQFVKELDIGSIKSKVQEAMNAGWDISQEYFKKEMEDEEFKDKMDPKGRCHHMSEFVIKEHRGGRKPEKTSDLEKSEYNN